MDGSMVRLVCGSYHVIVLPADSESQRITGTLDVEFLYQDLDGTKSLLVNGVLVV